MFKVVKSLFRRQPWPQLKFPTSGFEVVSDAVLLEEEQLEEFHIGDVFASKYQVIGKLGFGVTSTVWLARDLQQVSIRQSCYLY
jgi:serine/threonine-protein kinase SRPK3